jgi:hypothetical protein
MPAPHDQSDTPASRDREPGLEDTNPDREMDQDRADDVRPSDGRPAAGTGFGPQTPAPYAYEGERAPASVPKP